MVMITEILKYMILVTKHVMKAKVECQLTKIMLS